jgi:hypothetical protein
MNWTLTGFCTRMSCSSNKLEQLSTRGQIGCTVRKNGVDSWPLRLTDLDFSMLWMVN